MSHANARTLVPAPTHANLNRLADALRLALGQDAVQVRQPLARHTVYRIGGPADLLVVAHNASSLQQSIQLATEQQVPWTVLGGGSNILVSDAGVRGLVILNRTREITFFPKEAGADRPEEQVTAEGQQGSVRAESGVAFSSLARQCISRGWAGLEWAVGIPGSVGGAVFGNAGAWGGEVASALLEATMLGPDGAVALWTAPRFEFRYRSSVLKRALAAQQDTTRAGHGSGRTIILAAKFRLQGAHRQILESRAGEITARRKASQPTGATCGSVFKNPPGDYAGRLIEEAGLKGHRVGGAEVSPVHANFIINQAAASAADVAALIERIRDTVQARSGVRLELEIELLGEW